MNTAELTAKRFGPFADYFVVSRVGKGDKQVFMLDMPTSGEVPEENSLHFSAAVSHLKKNPSCPAVRFKISGWLSDFDPTFTTRKSRRAK